MNSNGFSRFLKIFSLGALVGGILATWLAPKGITWYFDPPVEMGFNCKAPIQWALKRLQWAQLIGIFSGGILAVILIFLLFRKNKASLPLSNEPRF